MDRVDARTSSGGYPIVVGEGALVELPRLLPEPPGRGLVVVDANVAEGAPELVRGVLAAREPVASLCTLCGGEEAKSFSTVETIIEALEQHAVGRDGWLAAVGGGSIGDVAGFAAATWLRGIRCYQVPTTLLAMVDSSIGGKTAINTALTKNSVGAFWQPSAVIADLRFLTTLPEVEYRAAFAEVVKYAVICDAAFFESLERDADRLLARDADALAAVVARCARIKASVVEHDERDERGGRALLNYGHTVGHALEELSGYRLRHGDAVAVGMQAAARLSAAAGLCDERDAARQDELLRRFAMPAEHASDELEAGVDAVMAAIQRDKKVRGDQVQWVLLREVGRAEPAHRLDKGLVRQVLGEVLR